MSLTPIPKWMQIKVLARDGTKCLRCGVQTYRWPDGKVRANTPAFDHIVPECREGMTTVENLQLLCTRCNRLKGNRIYDYRPRELRLVGGPVHRTEPVTTPEERARLNRIAAEERRALNAEFLERIVPKVTKVLAEEQRKADRKARLKAERWLRKQGKADKIPAFREQLRARGVEC